MIAIAPRDKFICFADQLSLDRMNPAGHNVEIVRVDVGVSPSRAASASGYRSPLDMLAMTRAVARASTDVFFSPSVYTYFPLPPGLRAVVTIHDAIAERFPELTVPSLRARTFWWMKMRLALFQARRILTVSEYAAGDVHRIHGVPRDKIDIAVEAPSPEFRRRARSDISAQARAVGLNDGARWFIYVGGFNPHKNIRSIITAHAHLTKASGTNAPHLLLVGTVDRDVFHGDVEGIRRSIEEAGTSHLVHWTGFIPDEELSALHSGAIALLLPSMVEGFGLPAVEAAACGSPVIATKESPLPQLLAGGGIFVDPNDDKALLDAMMLLERNESVRSVMAERALERARSLSWEKAAEAAIASLRTAAA